MNDAQVSAVTEQHDLSLSASSLGTRPAANASNKIESGKRSWPRVPFSYSKCTKREEKRPKAKRGQVAQLLSADLALTLNIALTNSPLSLFWLCMCCCCSSLALTFTFTCATPCE